MAASTFKRERQSEDPALSDRAQELLQNACEVFARAVVDGEAERAEDIALIAFAIAEIDRQDRDPADA